MVDDFHIGDIIAKHMKEKNLSYIELGRQSDVPASSIWRYVNENRTPGVTSFIKIAKVLEIDLNEF